MTEPHGSRDWRGRAALLYPLAVNAVTLRPDPAGRFVWEFVYFPAVARGGRVAVLLGVAFPVACAVAGLALPFTSDLPAAVVLPLMLVGGFGLTLGCSLAGAYVMRRPYWQPGVVSLLLLAVATGVPLMLVARALNAGTRTAVLEHVLEWVAMQGALMGVGCAVAAVLWLPVAWWLYRRRGVGRAPL
ncbi:hypothetical protein [Nonomuraea sp. NPDC050202]|uniref:hypothetical protein n=1 Tax=Nonomuraea sp. NPDC050202 TaxID=3155035 RepID=UPI0033CB946B